MLQLPTVFVRNAHATENQTRVRCDIFISQNYSWDPVHKARAHFCLLLDNINTFPSYLSNGMTFREYALRNGGGLKPNRHPDEKSHELFTEHIYENLC